MQKETFSLVIVVPCYNEEAVLTETTQRLLGIAGRLRADGVSTHILYVDDGSRDATWSLISQLSAAHAEVWGLKLAVNAGHQHALWAGLEAAVPHADAIVSIDADLQDDPDVILQMVAHYREGADLVFGVRDDRSSDSWFKRATAQGFYRMMQAMGTDLVYNHADYRLMSRRAVRALLAFPERNLFLRGMVKQLGFRQAVVTYARQKRQAGESKYPLSKMLAFAWDGITSFSVRPLRLFIGLGLVFILVSFVVIGWALVVHFSGHSLQGWTSLLISVWFVGGAILIALGIIGEYVGKIYSEVKRRPRYIEDCRCGMPEAGNGTPG